jgi:hypothetical protein
MGGAQITVTLYRNGIHLTCAEPALVSSPELEAEMRRGFDAGEDDVQLAGRLLFDRELVKVVAPAIDVYWAEDKRDVDCPGGLVPVPFPPKG